MTTKLSEAIKLESLLKKVEWEEHILSTKLLLADFNFHLRPNILDFVLGEENITNEILENTNDRLVFKLKNEKMNNRVVELFNHFIGCNSFLDLKLEIVEGAISIRIPIKTIERKEKILKLLKMEFAKIKDRINILKSKGMKEITENIKALNDAERFKKELEAIFLKKIKDLENRITLVGR